MFTKGNIGLMIFGVSCYALGAMISHLVDKCAMQEQQIKLLSILNDGTMNILKNIVKTRVEAGEAEGTKGIES